VNSLCFNFFHFYVHNMEKTEQF